MSDENSEIIFSLQIEDECKKVMTISPKGIHFHRENFVDWTPDDFANAVIKQLEESFSISFKDMRLNETVKILPLERESNEPC